MYILFGLAQVSFFVRICDLIVMVWLIYKAVRLFNDRHVSKKFRTVGAFTELACAVACVLAFSGNFNFMMVGLTIIIVVSFLLWSQHVQRKLKIENAKREMDKNFRAFKADSDKLDKVLKRFEKDDPKLAEKIKAKKKRYRTDPAYRAKIKKQHQETLNNILHNRKDPQLMKDEKSLKNTTLQIQRIAKEAKSANDILMNFLKAHPKMMKTYKHFNYKLKHDPQFKKSVNERKGKGWEEFKPFRDKVKANIGSKIDEKLNHIKAIETHKAKDTSAK